MRGKRARCLALHKSKFEYGRGRRSPAGLSASFHVGSYFCVSPWGSCCPFGLWPRVRGTRNDPGREKAEDRKRREGGRRMEEREKEPGKGVKGEKKRDSRTYARAWRGRRRKRERERRGVKGAALSARIVGRRMCGPSTNARSSLSFATGALLCRGQPPPRSTTTPSIILHE